MKIIEMDDINNQWSELIKEVESGQEIVFTRSHKPIARLVAAQKKRTRHFGSAKGLIKMDERFDEPLEDFKDYM